MRYVLGMDGGGSKLMCVLADETGLMIGASIAGPTSSSYNTPQEIEQSITAGISELLTKYSIDPTDISIVYAAFPADSRISLAAIKKNLPKETTVNILGEWVLSLYGAIQEEYGIVVQAGTGSFAFVKTPLIEKSVGGWGNILGDEGSGYYIGRKALMACSRMSDGYEVYTTLQERLLAFSKLELMRELCTLIYSTPSNKQSTLIASFCPIVGKCASEGDQVAIHILEDAAEKLFVQASTALQQPGVGAGFPLTVAGGVWKTSPILFNSFKDQINLHYPDVDIRTPLFEPVIGGVLLGLRDLGFPVKLRLEELKSSFSSFVLPAGLFG